MELSGNCWIPRLSSLAVTLLALAVGTGCSASNDEGNKDAGGDPPGEISNWTKHVVESGFDRLLSVYVADIEGDGDLDIVVGSAPDDTIAWFSNDSGDGSAWNAHQVTEYVDDPRVLDVADIDCDGDLDIGVANFTSGKISFFENNAGDGSVWSERTVEDDFGEVISMQVVDMDGDGDQDVLAGAKWECDIAWWENSDGVGDSWVFHSVTLSWDDVTSVRATDFDSDGDQDVLASAYFPDGEIAWWEDLTGEGTNWERHVVDAAFDGAWSADVEDLDNDGDLDVMGAAWEGNEVAWWENTDGATGWVKHVLGEEITKVYHVQPADLDADGDMDVVAISPDPDSVTWWENLAGNGTEWNQRPIVVDHLGIHRIHIADIDGDDDLDVVGVASSGTDEVEELVWWESDLVP